ncbi:unnamed protein product [Lactuca virosa]|uniref:AB hydrolase-1 domain-containing protein n=1 Tax=Lactuca virosa TaxID=75947 RepID=A0AAU9PPY1_9ASTR|nr:unnamed protein product [Lactuca virosa]
MSTKYEISPEAARSHTRKSKPDSSSVILKKFLLVIFVGFFAWAYQTALPPPPKTVGSPDGPPITSPRIKLRDGRHLSYIESATASPALVEELGVYFVAIDRPGYGESDPDPKRTVKSLAFDIEELADQLNLGPKFYVAGYSMGGQVMWSCLKYIPHRLAGAVLIAPGINYWWPNLPSNLTNEAFFRTTSTGSMVSAFASKLFAAMDPDQLQAWNTQPRQQGEFESLHRDINIGFGKWDFDPMDLKNPFPNNDGSIHIWQGDEDLIVPVTLQRYIAHQLTWVKYHELTGTGHLLPFADGVIDSILIELLTKKN